MKSTGRKFSHCWLLLTKEHGIMGTDVVLTEDENGGLHFVPWEGYGAGKTIVTVLDSPYDLTPGVRALVQRLGMGYDVGGLLGEAYVEAVGSWFKRKVANPFANARKMWCSEALFFTFMQVSEFGIAPDVSDAVDPGVAFDTLVKAGGKPAAGYVMP